MKFFSLIRLKPYSSSTPEGRSQERHRRIALTASTSAFAQGISVLSALIWVPLTVNFLGNERYGVLMTVASIVTMLQFTDLGLGNGLLNALSKAKGREDDSGAQKYVATGFFILLLIGILVIATFASLKTFIPWHQIFKTESIIRKRELEAATTVFVYCFALGMPLNVVQKVQLGFQEGYLSNIWQSLGILFGLVAILFGLYLKAGLVWFVLALAGAPLIALALNSLFYFGFQRTQLRPKIKNIQYVKAKSLLKTGVGFFVLSIAAAMGFQSDNIVLARMIGPEAVTQYSIVAKLFLIAPLILGHVLAPLWPAYGEALARRDIVWVKKTLSKSFTLALLINIPSSALLVLFGSKIIHFWIGPQAVSSELLLIGFGIWAVFNSIIGPCSMFLNGANVIKFQIIFSLLMGVTNIIISIVLVRYIGLTGAIFGTVIAQLLFTIIPSVFFMRRFFSTPQRSSESFKEPVLNLIGE